MKAQHSLRSLLEKIKSNESNPVFAKLWRDTVLPNFLDACRMMFSKVDPTIIPEWLEWMGTKESGHFLNAVRQQRSVAWQRKQIGYIRGFLLATEALISGSWTYEDVPNHIMDQIASLFPTSSRSFCIDLISYLMSRRPPSQKVQKAAFPMVFTGGWQQAVIAQFRLYLTNSGHGEIFLTPEQALSIELDDDFTLAMQHAVEVSKKRFKQKKLHDVRITIETHTVGNQDLLQKCVVSGPSAGGAITLALWSLWENIPLDSGLVTSFALAESNFPPDGNCHAVDSIIEKAEACAREGFQNFLVAQDQNHGLTTWATGTKSIRIERAHLLDDAFKNATGLRRDLDKYYSTLIKKLDKTPWEHAGCREIKMQDIAIKIRVLKEEPSERGREEEREDKGKSPFEEWGKEPSARNIDPEVAQYYEEPSGEKRKHEVDWDYELKNIDKALILGAPGGGNTFLTRQTAVLMAKNSKDALGKGEDIDRLPIPLHIDLTRLATAIKENPDDPGIVLRESLDWRLSDSFFGWVVNVLRTKQIFLILDALDQVPYGSQPVLKEWLELVKSSDWKCHIIITCRSANYTGDLRLIIPWKDDKNVDGHKDERISEYELAPFRPSDVRNFCDQWFVRDKAKGEQLKELLSKRFSLMHSCRSPLVTTLICLAHEDKQLKSNISRGALYSIILSLLLKRAWLARKESLTEEDEDRHIWILEGISFPLFRRNPNINMFSHVDISDEITHTIMKKLNLSFHTDITENRFIESGILIKSGKDKRGESQFSFMHRSFLEYLVARHLKKAYEKDDTCTEELRCIINKKSWHPAWQEVMTFLAGEMKNPEPMLGVLADGKDDIFMHRRSLAALSIFEIPDTFAKKKEWVDRISSVLFPVWWDYISYDIDSACKNITRAMSYLCNLNNKPLTQLCKILQNGDAGARSKAARALGRLGGINVTADVINALEEALCDKDWHVRLNAVWAFVEIGVPAATDRVINALAFRALDDPHYWVRLNTIEALKQICEVTCGKLIHVLADRALKDDRHEVRFHAVHSIGELGETVVTQKYDVLLTALEDRGETVRREAAESLREIRDAPGKEVVIKALMNIVYNDIDPSVRRVAAESLLKIDDSMAIKAAIDEHIYEAPDYHCHPVRSVAMAEQVTSEESEVTPEMLAQLVKAIRSEKGNNRMQAAEKLFNMMAQGKRVFTDGQNPMILRTEIENIPEFKFTIQTVPELSEEHS